MMTLYSGTTCPFSQRCRIVLYEKGMDFQIIDVDLYNKPEDLAAFRSPDVQTLLGYHKAVMERSQGFFPTLSREDLDKLFEDFPIKPPPTWGMMLKTVRDARQMVRRQPVLLVLLAIGLFYGLYSEGFDRLWTPHLLENYQVPWVDAVDPVVWFGAIRAVALMLSLAATEAVRRRPRPLSCPFVAFESSWHQGSRACCKPTSLTFRIQPFGYTPKHSRLRCRFLRGTAPCPPPH